MRTPRDAAVPQRRHPAPPVASALPALRRLPSPGAWLWLVTPAALEAASLAALVLFHDLPGLLVALGTEVLGHG
jgi:hypothetical protein